MPDPQRRSIGIGQKFTFAAENRGRGDLISDRQTERRYQRIGKFPRFHTHIRRRHRPFGFALWTGRTGNGNRSRRLVEVDGVRGDDLARTALRQVA